MLKQNNLKKRYILISMNLIKMQIVPGTKIIKHGGIGMFLWLTTQI